MEQLVYKKIEQLENLEAQQKKEKAELKAKILDLGAEDWLKFTREQDEEYKQEGRIPDLKGQIIEQLTDWLTSSNWIFNNWALKTLRLKHPQLINQLINKIITPQFFKLKIRQEIKAGVFKNLRAIGYI